MTATGRRRSACLVALAVASALTTPQVSAHTGGSTGFATAVVSGGSLRYALTLSPTALPAATVEALRRARAGESAAADALLTIVRESVRISVDGTACAPGPTHISAPAAESESLTLIVDFACPRDGRSLVIRDDSFESLGPEHHTLLRVEVAGRTFPFALEPAAREARVTLGGSPAPGGGSFLLLGIHHILSGWDHLLFLVALLLGGQGFLSLLRIVTAFTVAHSITLALAVFDLVVMPDRLVESAIAFSIAVVAAENLWSRRTLGGRWLAAFVFGLVHGFGFSSALRELALPRAGLILSLLGFNVGVELGQAAVVAGLVPVLLAARRAGVERRLAVACSLVILVVGLVLTVARAVLA
jgi:hypothetical protein